MFAFGKSGSCPPGSTPECFAGSVIPIHQSLGTTATLDTYVKSVITGYFSCRTTTPTN